MVLHEGEIQLRDSTEVPDTTKVVIDSNESLVDTKKPWYKQIWERDRLMIFIIIAVILGFIIGIGINSRIQKLEEPDKTTVLVLIGE